MKRSTTWLVVGATVFLAAGISTAQEQKKVPDEILSELQYLVGSWEVSGRAGDAKINGTFSARWAKGKHCLITEDTFVDADQTEAVLGAGVLGWDPVNKRITHGGFSSDNNAYLNWWKVTPSGDWEGQVRGTEDGVESTAAFKLTKQGKNKFLFESKTPDDQELEVVYTKVPRQKKAGKKKQ